MRLTDIDAIPPRVLPVFCEGLVECLVELARGIVRDIEQRDIGGMSRAGQAQAGGCQPGQEGEGAHLGNPSFRNR